MMRNRLPYIVLALVLNIQEPVSAFLAPRAFLSHNTFSSSQSTKISPVIVALANSDDTDDDKKKEGEDNSPNQGKKPKAYYGKRARTNKNAKAPPAAPMSKEKKKEIVAQAAKDLRAGQNIGNSDDDDDSLLNIVNPFKAGKKLRQTLQSLTGIDQEKKTIYLDDRVGLSLAERNPDLNRKSDYVPEVLVVGATGEVGRLVVRKLLLDGNVKIRVLVRDLYSKTLNMLGTGVTYCQGDLGNYESLEYAVTDVDKIVFCAGAPRPDEADFQERFSDYLRETLNSKETPEADKSTSDLEWEKMESVLELRAKLAEQVDFIGMQNLVRAYQNVRYADYGASQTAKRSLFKFGSKNEDFNLFAIDEEEEDDGYMDGDYDYDEDALEAEEEAYYDAMSDEYDLTDGEEYSSSVQTRQGGVLTKTQCLWMRNSFNHAVFVGKVSDMLPGGEAAVVSSRLRSRDEPEMGIDLSNGFGGFIVRVCSDGGNYEAFIRTELYETEGIEYVCQFSTATKAQQKGNKSRNKFTTVRLGFENFKPVMRQGGEVPEDTQVRQFRGRDMRELGFRYRAEANDKNRGQNQYFAKSDNDENKYSQFYLAFDYIKVYRSQPEPEFVYLSDARVPPRVTNGMVRHDRKQLREKREDDSVVLLEEADILQAASDQRSSEETYYKYRGEELLKGSGLSYSIVRVSGYNEVSTGETSTIELTESNEILGAVSRSDVAQVCASALVDANALNKSFYISKFVRATRMEDENMSKKFAQLAPDL